MRIYLVAERSDLILAAVMSWVNIAWERTLDLPGLREDIAYCVAILGFRNSNASIERRKAVQWCRPYASLSNPQWGS